MSARDIVFIGVAITVIALSFFIVHYSYGVVSSKLINASPFNETNRTVDVLEKGNEIANRFDYIIFVVFMALSFSIVITGWFIGGNAIFAFLYFLVIVVAVVVSAILNNVWARFAETSAFVSANTVANFPITDALMSNLPLYVGIVGFIGLIVMFAKPALGGGRSR